MKEFFWFDPFLCFFGCHQNVILKDICKNVLLPFIPLVIEVLSCFYISSPRYLNLIFFVTEL